MSLLEVATADLGLGDVPSDGEHGNPAALGVEQPVDQVQVARSTAGRTHGQLIGDRRRTCRGKCRGLFMSNMLPSEVAVPPYRIRQCVQGVAGKSVDAPDSRGLESGHDEICAR